MTLYLRIVGGQIKLHSLLIQLFVLCIPSMYGRHPCLKLAHGIAYSIPGEEVLYVGV